MIVIDITLCIYSKQADMKQSNIGFEVNRKLFHLSSLWIPVVGLILPFDIALILFLGVGMLVLAVDAGRLLPGRAAKISFKLIKYLRFDKLYRKSEDTKLSGASYMLISAVISLIIFPADIFFISFTVLIVCDSLAAIIGTIWGSHKILGNKSMEGSVAFFISALILSVGFSWHFQYAVSSALLASFVATVGELFTNKLGVDDNLIIPIIFGLSFLIMA